MMVTRRWLWLLVLMLALTGLLVGCDEEDDYYDDEDGIAYYEDYDDEEYDEDEYDEDEYYDEEYDDEDWWGWDEAMTAEDCYDDEYFDEEDQMCYLLYDCDEDDEACIDLSDDFYTLAGELISVFLGDDKQWSEGSPDEVIILYEIRNNELTNPVRSSAAGEALRYQQDTQAHEQIWVYFANLIPARERVLISHFGIFTDGEGEVLAYVEPNPANPLQWKLYVDIIDSKDTQELTYTLIHEYAHIMTLNNNQVAFDAQAYYDEDERVYAAAEAACSTYFTGEGCSRPNSYIYNFFDRFWDEIYDDWLEYDEDTDGFYSQYEDHFVTDYAATNPAEDIAESFTFFVLQPKPNGRTIAEQKILFFYDYPELVQLRAEIAGRTYARLRR